MREVLGCVEARKAYIGSSKRLQLSDVYSESVTFSIHPIFPLQFCKSFVNSMEDQVSTLKVDESWIGKFWENAKPRVSQGTVAFLYLLMTSQGRYSVLVAYVH